MQSLIDLYDPIHVRWEPTGSELARLEEVSDVRALLEKDFSVLSVWSDKVLRESMCFLNTFMVGF